MNALQDNGKDHVYLHIYIYTYIYIYKRFKLSTLSSKVLNVKNRASICEGYQQQQLNCHYTA